MDSAPTDTRCPMKSPAGVRLRGTGSALPSRIFRNDEFPAGLETSDEWIRTRTGIRERRICTPEDTSSTLGIEAGRRALEAAGLQPGDIDLIICATLTPDLLVPSAACLIQKGLGCNACAAFDLNAACSGFIYGLATGHQFVQSGAFRHVLIVGVDTMSRVVDFNDRNTCILFGDGAGAVVISAHETPSDFWFSLHADGVRHQWVQLGGLALRAPATSAPLDMNSNSLDYLRMNGREIFKFAVNAIGKLIGEALAENHLTAADIDLVIPHQVNQRILESACSQIGFSLDKFMINLDRYGNTSAGSVPIALDEAIRSGRLQPHQRALLIAFGGGLTWASALLRI
jgi:3-oxoacyl-[acyl-carrier-protein] synthase III